jgi:hypothetical protein
MLFVCLEFSMIELSIDAEMGIYYWEKLTTAGEVMKNFSLRVGQVEANITTIVVDLVSGLRFYGRD